MVTGGPLAIGMHPPPLLLGIGQFPLAIGMIGKEMPLGKGAGATSMAGSIPLEIGVMTGGKGGGTEMNGMKDLGKGMQAGGTGHGGGGPLAIGSESGREWLTPAALKSPSGSEKGKGPRMVLSSKSQLLRWQQLSWAHPPAMTHASSLKKLKKRRLRRQRRVIHTPMSPPLKTPKKFVWIGTMWWKLRTALWKTLWMHWQGLKKLAGTSPSSAMLALRGAGKS